MLIAIILSNLEEAQKQYNDLVKDKFKRKQQLVNAIKDMPLDPMSLETAAMSVTVANPSGSPRPANTTTSSKPDTSSNTNTDKSIPPISLMNATHPNADSNINPITSRNLGGDAQRPTDVLRSSNKTVSIAQKRVMEEYNRAFSQSADREKQLTLQYFMGLASIENELSLYLFIMRMGEIFYDTSKIPKSNGGVGSFSS